MNRHAIISWTLIFTILLAIVLVPFFLFEAEIRSMTELLIKGNYTWQLAVALGVLLSSDIFLPVPSSIVSTASGAIFGFWYGLLVSWIGMTTGCLLGYFLGKSAGRPAVVRLAGEKESIRVQKAAKRYGYWVITLFRAVPVLAEVSVVFAGISHMPFGRFATISTLSNLGISIIYVGIGVLASDFESFLMAFIGSILIPGIFLFSVKSIKNI